MEQWIWDNLTKKAPEAIDQAMEEAAALVQNQVEPEYLLLGILRRGDSIAAIVLDKIGVSLASVENTIVQRHVSVPDAAVTNSELSASFFQIVKESVNQARILNHNDIGTEHLLLSLAGKLGTAGDTLREQGVTQDGLRQIIVSVHQDHFRLNTSQ